MNYLFLPRVAFSAALLDIISACATSHFSIWEINIFFYYRIRVHDDDEYIDISFDIRLTYFTFHNSFFASYLHLGAIAAILMLIYYFLD